MTETPQKNNTMRNILIGGCIVVLACVICVGAVIAITGGSVLAVFNLVAAPLTTANSFMVALESQNYDAAYALVHPEQQASFGGSPEGLQETLTNAGLLPVTSHTLTNINVENDQGTAVGTAVFDGSSKNLRVHVKKSGEAWLVIGMDQNQP